MTRHEQRYKAMTILYQAFLYESNNIEYDIKEIIKEQLEEKNKFIDSLVKGVIENKEMLSDMANKYLENWDISRLGFTDQAIILIGIYEIINTDTPDLTCIDEAIELSKEYSDDKVSKMINGVLDKVYHSKVENDR
ncbi:MAG: transcription antitermination factor NusB [Bacilli bacterium]|nr:transcription antitermination factor NusB [Bacilli bacterium]